MWIVFHLVPLFALYSVGGALLYRPVYKHFYEKQRLIKEAKKDRWGDYVLDGSRNRIYVYREHETAHVEALIRATFAAALWPVSVWPLVVFKTATPVTPARKQELADLAEEQKLERDLKRKQMLAKMEKELGIDTTYKVIEGGVIGKEKGR